MGNVSAGAVDTVEEGLKSMAKQAIGSYSTYKIVGKEVKAEIQGMYDASKKTIHVSIEAVDGSIEFYNEIFDNDE